ncbi:MAG TPA: hypothetical protein DHV36_15305 [Desulfobacteraceae bacterium]|nr:hypothetical protein [Desulfobacteraceae bacterium]|tara:strand:- start:272 stop:1147 length:876 start_codon:yes stop_codon:yes gene_type:complete
MDQNDLIIPVYLNQRVVFDLVAVLEGGIASVTQVSKTQTELEGQREQIGASFGVSNALSSLLKIDLTGKRANQSSDESSKTTTEDRIHTPVSLFIALRSILHEKKYLKNIESEKEVVPGDLIEFSTVLKRNPLVETLESFVELIDMVKVFERKPNKGKGKQNDEFYRIKNQIVTLLSSLKNSESLDLTTPPLKSSHRAVVSIETKNLNDPSMSDLVDGTFRVVGKVTRSIKNSNDSISLNRKSAFNRLPISVLEEFKKAFQAPALAEMDFPELEWEIKGPAIQVLPIAIFA